MLYKDMYYRLFNAVTDAISAIEGGDVFRARKLLMDAQRKTEEMFIDGEEDF